MSSEDGQDDIRRQINSILVAYHMNLMAQVRKRAMKTFYTWGKLLWHVQMMQLNPSVTLINKCLDAGNDIFVNTMVKLKIKTNHFIL